jgi:hypothetical protein
MGYFGTGLRRQERYRVVDVVCMSVKPTTCGIGRAGKLPWRENRLSIANQRIGGRLEYRSAYFGKKVPESGPVNREFRLHPVDWWRKGGALP